MEAVEQEERLIRKARARETSSADVATSVGCLRAKVRGDRGVGWIF